MEQRYIAYVYARRKLPQDRWYFLKETLLNLVSVFVSRNLYDDPRPSVAKTKSQYARFQKLKPETHHIRSVSELVRLSDLRVFVRAA